MRDNTSGDGTDGARPLLVLVAGAPASGKSTLARLLAARLALPLLPRDPITHALADALRPASREQMQPLVLASFQVFYALIAEFLQADGVVAETNFHRGVSELQLRPLIAQATTVLIHCQISREVSIRRFVERFVRGERHWSCFDEERIAKIEAGQPQDAWDLAQPLDLGVPTLMVDTSDGYAPEIEAITAFIRSAMVLAS